MGLIYIFFFHMECSMNKWALFASKQTFERIFSTAIIANFLISLPLQHFKYNTIIQILLNIWMQSYWKIINLKYLFDYLEHYKEIWNKQINAENRLLCHMTWSVYQLPQLAFLLYHHHRHRHRHRHHLKQVAIHLFW